MQFGLCYPARVRRHIRSRGPRLSSGRVTWSIRPGIWRAVRCGSGAGDPTRPILTKSPKPVRDHCFRSCFANKGNHATMNSPPLRTNTTFLCFLIMAITCHNSNKAPKSTVACRVLSPRITVSAYRWTRRGMASKASCLTDGPLRTRFDSSRCVASISRQLRTPSTCDDATIGW